VTSGRRGRLYRSTRSRSRARVRSSAVGLGDVATPGEVARPLEALERQDDRQEVRIGTNDAPRPEDLMVGGAHRSKPSAPGRSPGARTEVGSALDRCHRLTLVARPPSGRTLPTRPPAAAGQQRGRAGVRVLRRPLLRVSGVSWSYPMSTSTVTGEHTHAGGDGTAFGTHPTRAGRSAGGSLGRRAVAVEGPSRWSPDHELMGPGQHLDRVPGVRARCGWLPYGQ